VRLTIKLWIKDWLRGGGTVQGAGMGLLEKMIRPVMFDLNDEGRLYL
jgi:hypothetical protein